MVLMKATNGELHETVSGINEHQKVPSEHRSQEDILNFLENEDATKSIGQEVRDHHAPRMMHGHVVR
jgi:hypothetical protein